MLDGGSEGFNVPWEVEARASQPLTWQCVSPEAAIDGLLQDMAWKRIHQGVWDEPDSNDIVSKYKGKH